MHSPNFPPDVNLSDAFRNRLERLTDGLRDRSDEEIESERQHFRVLISVNPNYFGTAPDTSFEAVSELSQDTRYEELECVGYHPRREELEAVVHVKRDTGYLGDVCTDGSREYVRFFVDWDGDGTWSDAGMASFPVHDIDGKKPLEYACSVRLDPSEKWCGVENLPRVRAILSWNQPPAAGDADFTPVWGNVLEGTIQIDPKTFIAFPDLLSEFDLQIPDELQQIVDPENLIPLKEPTTLSLNEISELYRETDVAPHRFAFKELSTSVETPGAGLAFPGLEASFAEIEPETTAGTAAELFDLPSLLDLPWNDVPGVLDDLVQTEGDTTYEELTCVGLDTEEQELVATLRLKRASGYLGGLCTDGSSEYVAFWVDWGTGTWTHAGTTSVRVYDLDSIPEDGLDYSVALPVDLAAHRQPCEEGARTVRVRAVLSWETLPSSTDPDWTPTWGNREDTRVQIPSGEPIDPRDHRAFLQSLGNMHVCTIDQSSGLASGTSITGFSVTDAPFGGRITIAGWINNPPNRVANTDPTDWYRYRISVRSHPGGTWQTITDPFTIWVTEQTGPSDTPSSRPVRQEPDADGFYTYRHHVHGSQYHRVAGNVLAHWHSGPREGLWAVRLEVKEPVTGDVESAALQDCPDGTQRGTVVLRLDQTRPVAKLKITGTSTTGNHSDASGDEDCYFVEQGTWIHGNFTARDPNGHFARYGINVIPSSATTDPSGGSWPTVSTHGTSGQWKLDTSGMDPCGYIVRLSVRDRTIRNNHPHGWGRTDVDNFCVTD